MEKNLKNVLNQHGIGVMRFAKAVGISKSTAQRLLSEGKYPARDPGARNRVQAVLSVLQGGEPVTPCPSVEQRTKALLVRTQQAKEKPQSRANSLGASASATTSENEKEQHMLIQKHTITPEARQFWGVKPDALTPPWRQEQVFAGGDMRVIYEHMRAKALYGGLLAVVGESGAGKTTIKDWLVSDLAATGDVVVIEPHTQAMEADDVRGKTLKTSHLNEAILREVAPGKPLRRTMEAQLNQVASALSESLAENRERRHLLIIDEAHALPKPTLRHLKRFLEMKDPLKKGLQRPLLSIALLGQPELATRLSRFDMDVREVWQRCEVVQLNPLGKSLEAYLKFRLGNAAEAFAPDALVKLAEVLSAKDGTSFLYPLAVDNWLALILNKSAGLGKTITLQHVAKAHADAQKGGWR